MTDGCPDVDGGLCSDVGLCSDDDLWSVVSDFNFLVLRLDFNFNNLKLKI